MFSSAGASTVSAAGNATMRQTRGCRRVRRSAESRCMRLDLMLRSTQSDGPCGRLCDVLGVYSLDIWRIMQSGDVVVAETNPPMLSVV